MGTLCRALAAFSYLSSRVSETSFAHLYVDLASIYIVTRCRDLALFALLVMPLCKPSGWQREALGAMTLGFGTLELTNFILAAQKRQHPPVYVLFLSGRHGSPAGAGLQLLGVELAAVVFPSVLPAGPGRDGFVCHTSHAFWRAHPPGPSPCSSRRKYASFNSPLCGPISGNI